MKNLNTWMRPEKRTPKENKEYLIYARCFMNNKWGRWNKSMAIYRGDGKWMHNYYSDEIEIAFYCELPDDPDLEQRYETL